MRTKLSALTLAASLAASLHASPSWGQPKDPAPPLPVPVAPPPDAPAPRPAVDDPLLKPVPKPQKTLASWRDVVDLVRTRSLELKVAAEEIERAKGNERVALAAVLPTLTATGSGTAHLINLRTIRTLDQGTGQIVDTQVPPSPVFAASITGRQSVVSLRAWYGIGTASMGVDAAKLRVADRERLVLAQAANALVSVIAAERTAELSRVGLTAALERLELMKKRERLGAATRLDVVRSEQDANLVRATLVQSDEQLRRSRETLGLSLGLGEPLGVSPSITVESVEQAVKVACKGGKVDERPDVRAAKLDAAIGERGMTDVKLGFLPTLDFVTTASTQTRTVFTPAPETWIAQGVITVPIWDGGARYGQLRVAQALSSQARLRHEQTTLAAEVEVRQAQRSVEVAALSASIAAQSRALARETRALAEAAFAGGSGTSLEVVDASRRERESELEVAVRELEIARTRIASMLALATCTLR